MLKMSAHTAVFGDRSPAIFQNFNAWLAGVDHRLDRNDHAFAQLHSAATLTVVGNLWVFVHTGSDAVADKVAHNGKPFSFDHFLYRCANVTEGCTWLHNIDSRLQGCLCCGQQTLRSGIDLFANRDGNRRVAVEAVDNRSTVNGDNIALFQNPIFGGDAVHYFLIDRRAEAAGKSVIALECRLGSEVLDAR